MDPAAAAEVAAAAWSALACAVAGGGRVRVSRDGGRSFPRSTERDLAGHVADRPAAVLVFGPAGTARCLVADLDASRGGIARVDADAARLTALVRACGGRVFADVSPSGGRHVYVPLADPVPFEQVRAVVLALGVLLPSLDVGPATNLLSGCIRPPGSRHRSGGWQTLTTPLAQAVEVARRPNGPGVWAALVAALRPQLAGVEPPRADPGRALPAGAAGGLSPSERRAHDACAPRAGGRLPLRAEVLAIAREAVYDPARYATPSQARQRVLASAAASGWTFAEVQAELRAGAWPGLWSFYARYPVRHRAERLAADWLAAVAHARRPHGSEQAVPPASGAGEGHAHNPDTRKLPTQRAPSDPSPLSRSATPAGSPAEHGFLRSWVQAVELVEGARYAGRGGHARRLALRAVGNAAQKAGSRYVAFGVRSLSLAAGLSKTATAAALAALREESDPLLVRLEAGRGLRGDLYELRLPLHLEQAVARRAWRPGLIEAVHPVFRALGAPAAFVYERLDAHPAPSLDLAARAQVSARAAQTALTGLAEHGLAARTRTGWVRGPADPTDVARALGVLDTLAELAARYRAERVAWRARLAAVAPLTVADVLTPSTDSPPGGGEPDWPVLLAQPPPEEPETPLELLYRVLGAVPLPT